MDSFIRLLVTYAIFLFIYNLVSGGKKRKGEVKRKTQQPPARTTMSKNSPVSMRPLPAHKRSVTMIDKQQSRVVSKEKNSYFSSDFELEKTSSTIINEVEKKKLSAEEKFLFPEANKTEYGFIFSGDELIKGIILSEILSPCLARRTKRK